VPVSSTVSEWCQMVLMRGESGSSSNLQLAVASPTCMSAQSQFCNTTNVKVGRQLNVIVAQ